MPQLGPCVYIESSLCADVARRLVRDARTVQLAGGGAPPLWLKDLIRDLVTSGENSTFATGSSVNGTVVVPTGSDAPHLEMQGADIGGRCGCREASEQLRMSEEMIRRLCRSGALRAEKRFGTWEISQASIDNYAAQRGERKEDRT